MISRPALSLRQRRLERATPLDIPLFFIISASGAFQIGGWLSCPQPTDPLDQIDDLFQTRV